MKHSILVIDDEKFNRQIIIDILGRAEKEYSVMSADSGKIGCELAEKFSPNLILMDWMMPNMTGLEALIRLKAQQKTKHIPIIMVTGVTAPEKLKEAFEVGMDDYISKPVNDTELLTKVESSLNIRE